MDATTNWKAIAMYGGAAVAILALGVTIGLLIAYYRSSKARHAIKKFWKRIKRSFKAKKKNRKQQQQRAVSAAGTPHVTSELTGMHVITPVPPPSPQEKVEEEDTEDEELTEEDIALLMMMMAAMGVNAEDIEDDEDASATQS